MCAAVYRRHGVSDADTARANNIYSWPDYSASMYAV